jgi:predicted DNA-binding protein (UPF0251 family)
VDRLRGELRLMSITTGLPSEDIEEVRQALARLSADDRELLLLTNWEGLSPTEVAVAMGIPAGTVRSRLHRARQQLRRQLAADLEPFEPLEVANGIERCDASGHVHAGERALVAESEERR